MVTIVTIITITIIMIIMIINNNIGDIYIYRGNQKQ